MNHEEPRRTTKERNKLQYFNYKWHEEHEGWGGHEEKVFLGEYEEIKDLLIIGDGWGSIPA